LTEDETSKHCREVLARIPRVSPASSGALVVSGVTLSFRMPAAESLMADYVPGPRVAMAGVCSTSSAKRLLAR